MEFTYLHDPYQIEAIILTILSAGVILALWLITWLTKEILRIEWQIKQTNQEIEKRSKL